MAQLLLVASWTLFRVCLRTPGAQCRAAYGGPGTAARPAGGASDARRVSASPRISVSKIWPTASSRRKARREAEDWTDRAQPRPTICRRATHRRPADAQRGLGADARAHVQGVSATALDAGLVPWHRPWRVSEHTAPRNVISGKAYRGINIMLLGFASDVGGYAGPWWLTYKQGIDLGGHVRRGDEYVGKPWIVHGGNRSELSPPNMSPWHPTA